MIISVPLPLNIEIPPKLLLELYSVLHIFGLSFPSGIPQFWIGVNPNAKPIQLFLKLTSRYFDFFVILTKAQKVTLLKFSLKSITIHQTTVLNVRYLRDQDSRIGKFRMINGCRCRKTGLRVISTSSVCTIWEKRFTFPPTRPVLILSHVEYRITSFLTFRGQISKNCEKSNDRLQSSVIFDRSIFRCNRYSSTYNQKPIFLGLFEPLRRDFVRRLGCSSICLADQLGIPKFNFTIVFVEPCPFRLALPDYYKLLGYVNESLSESESCLPRLPSVEVVIRLVVSFSDGLILGSSEFFFCG